MLAVGKETVLIVKLREIAFYRIEKKVNLVIQPFIEQLLGARQ